MPENITLKINGRAQEEIEYDLVEVLVDTNLFLPAMFSITLQDEYDVQTGKFKYIDSETIFKVGAEVVIEVQTDEIPDETSPVKATLINGEITSLEPVFTGGGLSQLRIRGYDRAHHLARGKKTRTYGDANPKGSGITDEQIVNKIVQETGGVSGKMVDTSGMSGIKYNYVMQYNQSDWDFLWSRARQLGYQVYVEEKKLYFQKADAHRGAASEKPATLKWGDNLSSFEPRLSSIGQLSKVQAKGWDPDKQAAIEGSSGPVSTKNLAKIGVSQKGSDVAKQAFGLQALETLTVLPVSSPSQAKALAQARLMQAESSFVKAEGRCRQGDPRLRAGRIVTVENIGTRFSGDYYITEARHEWLGGQYMVSFSATGYNPNTLHALLAGEEPQDNRNQPGVVTAKVTNLEDPEKLGRVQVTFPWMEKYNNADLSSNWARVAAPGAGQERGLFFTPEVDDEVLVAFEHGDPDFPYIVGALWNSKQKPPKGSKEVLDGGSKKVNQRVLCSRSGHLIILDDTQGEEQILIQDKTKKNSILINSKDNSMTIKSQGDLILDSGGKVILKSKGDLSLTSNGKGTISSTGELSFDSKQKAMLKAGTSQLALEMAGSTLKGVKVDITADTQAALKGNAMVQVQGALVKIN